MHSSQHSAMMRSEQEFAPLLFSLSAGEAAVAMTPRAATPHRRDDSSMSTQRRSATTPGSVHTETTPPTPPPPVMRLTDDMVMDEPSSSKAVPPPVQSLNSAGGLAARSAAAIAYEQVPQYQDIWVTVFGFAQQDASLIMREMGKCGDILQWGTFGDPAANFLHVQFQNKYAAQRALTRNGEQLSPTLIIGVKPLDHRHRAAIERYHAPSGESVSFSRQTAQPERPYRIERPNEIAIPQPRSTVSKLYEYVFGF